MPWRSVWQREGAWAVASGALGPAVQAVGWTSLVAVALVSVWALWRRRWWSIYPVGAALAEGDRLPLRTSLTLPAHPSLDGRKVYTHVRYYRGGVAGMWRQTWA